MPVSRFAPMTEDHVGLHDRVKVLRTGRLTQRLLQAINRRGVANARAGITLLLPEAARSNFWTRYVSSLLQREEVIPPIESRPYFAESASLTGGMADGVPATTLRARGRLIFARIMGLQMRSV